MNDRELMQQALEALTEYDGTNGESKRKRILVALRERLKQPEQEPVAWMVYSLDGESVCVTDNPSQFTDKHKELPLYTAPQPAQQPLTYPQIHELDWPDDVSFEDILLFVRAIEAAHGIGDKNGLA